MSVTYTPYTPAGSHTQMMSVLDAELKQHIGNMAKHKFNLVAAMLYYFNPIAFEYDGEAGWGGVGN